MLKLLSKKIGMTHCYDKEGYIVPVTIIKAYDNVVIDSKDLDNECSSIKVGFKIEKKEKNTNKSVAGLFKKSNLPVFGKIIESKVSNDSFKKNNSLDLSFIKEGSLVKISGKSIGKGFAGAMKRHNFGGLEASHGISVSHRSHGSTGQCQDPGKVFKGKKMAGRMGNRNVTIKNLRVFKKDDENNLLFISGAVPGHKGSDVVLLLNS
jgi:large subunit ribosomal protein L3